MERDNNAAGHPSRAVGISVDLSPPTRRSSLQASRLREPIVKHHEGQRLAHLTLQIEAAGQLHSVAVTREQVKAVLEFK